MDNIQGQQKFDLYFVNMLNSQRMFLEAMRMSFEEMGDKTPTLQRLFTTSFDQAWDSTGKMAEILGIKLKTLEEIQSLVNPLESIAADINTLPKLTDRIQ
jgi:hypothetical protein